MQKSAEQRLKERMALEVMALTRRTIILHDDKLLVRFQKSDIGVKKGGEWKKFARIVYKDGMPKIVGYFDPYAPAGMKNIGSLEDVPESERQNYRPMYEWTVDVGPGTRIALVHNQLDIHILDLHRDLHSRYKKALENTVALANKGILSYRAHSKKISPHNLEQALRQRLVKYAHVSEYEHNILLRGDLGERIYEALKDRDKGEYAGRGTIYFQHNTKYPRKLASMKYYDIVRRARHQGIILDEGVKLHKLEVTFHKALFKKRGITINTLLEQPDIQQLLHTDLVFYVKKALRTLGPEERKALQTRMGLESIDIKGIVAALLDPRRTLTRQIARLNRLAVDPELSSAERKKIARSLGELEALRTDRNIDPQVRLESEPHDEYF